MTRWRPKTTLVIIGLIVLIAAGFLVWFFAFNSNSQSIVKKLPRESISTPPVYLTDKDQPLPTNAWFSGLVFKRPSMPVYAYPWALSTTNSGPTLSYPEVKSTPNTVFTDDVNDLKIDFGTKTALVQSFDDLSVNLSYQNGDKEVANLRLTHGSPYVFVSLASGASVRLVASGQISKRTDRTYIIKLAGKRYGLAVGKNAAVKSSGSNLTIRADKSAQFTLITLPQSLNETLAFRLANNPIKSASFSYQIKNNQAITTFNIATKNGQPTLFGLLPHQYQNQPNLKTVGNLLTLLGEQKFVSGNHFSYSLPAKIPNGKIISRKLSPFQSDKLKQLVTQDVAGLKFDKTDTYFAGKQLYKTANLLELAHELGEKKVAAKVQKLLKQQLDMWLDPNGCKRRSEKCFYYDPKVRGVIGKQASFDSDKFNDHNFHYGYFIYAASVLGRYDPDFVRQNQAMVDLLVSDIASSRVDDNFPKLRSFDAYAGHSWADGYGLAADGNNQESSSEAVNAWCAMYLWARVTRDQDMMDLARWLYVNESNAALTYWLNIDESAPQFSQYQHPIVSLVWGGKLDYATYFSNTPAAKLGIQLIPMSPGQIYLKRDTTRIKQNLASVGTNPSQFKDYLIMYRALADPAKAKAELPNLNSSSIDDANSLAYTYAWVFMN